MHVGDSKSEPNFLLKEFRNEAKLLFDVISKEYIYCHFVMQYQLSISTII